MARDVDPGRVAGGSENHALREGGSAAAVVELEVEVPRPVRSNPGLVDTGGAAGHEKRGTDRVRRRGLCGEQLMREGQEGDVAHRQFARFRGNGSASRKQTADDLDNRLEYAAGRLAHTLDHSATRNGFDGPGHCISGRARTEEEDVGRIHESVEHYEARTV